ncbi:MAG: hypothetical protein LQ350_003274 [Teloschistes chrysophthalmus]|nr:MAG: hypothetical protein LQ350_003274 [Niorma chrysophthalma]
MVTLRASTIISVISAFPLLAFALPTLNITSLNTHRLGDSHPIVCWDPQYAPDPADYAECNKVIDDQIATVPHPGLPYIFSRLQPFHNVPKRWWSPRGKCFVEIDVAFTMAEQASFLAIQAAAREIATKCVLGAHHLGGVTLIGALGGLKVEVLGDDGWAPPGRRVGGSSS